MIKIKVALVILFVTVQIIWAQESSSIHKLEYEAHLNSKLAKNNLEESAEDIIPLNKSVVKNLSDSVFGFYPDWEHQKGAHNNFNYDLLTHIAAFDFPVSSTGQITDPLGWPWTNVINEAHNNGVKVIMVVVNFEADEINKIMTHSFTRWAFMLGVQSKIKKYNLDGVNIDFEGLNVADRGSVLNDFMQELTDSVHSINDELEVSFDAPAVNWGGWELTQLAQSCDYLFVMAYDFYGSWSSATGPTAPLLSNSPYNVKNTISQEYGTISTFYPHKIILGVPYYGPHWTTSTDLEGANTIEYVEAKRFWEAQSESETYGTNWSTTFQNSWYDYKSGSTNHQVWFDNDSSLGLKYDLALSKKLKGIGMWALGYDGSRDELWNLIEDKFSIPVGVDDIEQVPSDFNLEQNYPNPFNPETSIRYSINGENQKVQLQVYNVLGQNVQTLVNGTQDVGQYEIKFDASKLPSGIYYYILRQGDNFETRKMSLIK